MKKIVEFRNVFLNYHSNQGETLVLDDISFDIYDGEFVAIVGPSGCGKTTILSLIAGLMPISKGELLVDGKPITMTSNEIGYMFQKDHLFEWRTIFQNICLSLEMKKYSKEQLKIEKNNILLLIKKYGLIDFIDSYPSQLSGGMRQRVALIRTLAMKPKVLLLDEPFSALDYQTRLKVCDDVSNIIKSENKTTILVTHDISEAISMADRIIVLTERPAKIKSHLKIDLQAYGEPLKRRESKDFGLLFDKIWKELQTNEK